MNESFAKYLETRLPAESKIRVYHISTPPSASPPLYAAAPGEPEEETWCESHFLAISQQLDANENDVIVLGIEVLVFTTQHLTTVFVSKADSTGFLTRPPPSSPSRSIPQTTITAFLEFLIGPRLAGPRLVLSLFARAQNQYLFPGSIENATKHVLDDRQLIKWWCRVLEPLVRLPTPLADALTDETTIAHVVIPGLDSSETRSFFPHSARPDPSIRVRWTNKYPVTLLVNDPSRPPRCLVPRLPDDPKSRFLNDLDSHVDERGAWRGIKTLDEFWEMMSYRQECSAGRMVGFVWVVYPKAQSRQSQSGEPSRRPEAAESLRPSQPTHSRASNGSAVATDSEGVQPTCSLGDQATIHDAALASTVPTAIPDGQPPPPDQARKMPILTADRSGEARAKPALSWPHPTRGQLQLDKDKYESLMDFLLELDFAGESLARESTTRWTDKAKDMAAAVAFGIEVEGRMAVSEQATPVTITVPARTVNLLTGTRKKRKAESTDVSRESQQPSAAVNSLDAALIRKRAKDLQQ